MPASSLHDRVDVSALSDEALHHLVELVFLQVLECLVDHAVRYSPNPVEVVVERAPLIYAVLIIETYY
ncbi:MAG: hypothetical protein QXE10_06000 [Desulfurococcaceae archaeon]